MKKIIINLKDLRKARDLTQQELAENLGVSRQSIIAVEGGKFLPSIELAWEIANFFNLTIDNLLSPCFHYKYNNTPTEDIERKVEENMNKDLTEWTPTKEMDTFRNAMDRLFEDFFGEETKKPETYFPRIEVTQTKENVTVKCEIPGVDPDDINVSIENDMLSVEGEKKIEKEEKEKNWHRREISYGNFSRAIILPHLVISDKAVAKFKNGMLTIVAPLMEEVKPRSKKIKIETESNN